MTSLPIKHIILVGGDWNMRNVIIPIDELIFFEGFKPPTSITFVVNSIIG